MTVNIKTKPAAEKKAPKKAIKKKAFMDTEVSTVEAYSGNKDGTTVENIPQASTGKAPVPAESVGPTTNAEVEFALQTIIPTGEYTNLRVYVGAKCRCDDDTDVMDAVFDILKDWVDSKITDVTNEIKGDAGAA